MFSITLTPCDLGQIADSGQCFRMKKTDDNRYRICAADRCVYAVQDGDTLTLSCDENEFNEFWKNYFDFDTDYAAFCASTDPDDEFLTAAVSYGSGIRILRQDIWEMIITFVISQNNNIPRIQNSVQKICENFGDKKTDCEGEIYYTFPTKEQLQKASIDELRACGLGYRDRYLYEIAHSDFDANTLIGQPMDKAHEMLCSLTGVGNKVAHCVRLFGLHDLAAFPMDTWMKKMCDLHYNGAFPLERYDGYAGVMQQYIFFYARTSK